MSITNAIMIAGLACALFGGFMLAQRGTPEVGQHTSQGPHRR